MQFVQVFLVLCACAAFYSSTLAQVQTTALPARCAKDFCETAAEQGSICPEVPPNCTAGAADFYGWEALSPDACNCCPHCIAYLGLNDVCPVGQATGIVPTHMCGPGLYCFTDLVTKESRCRPMAEVVKTAPPSPSFDNLPALDILPLEDDLDLTTVNIMNLDDLPVVQDDEPILIPQFNMDCSKEQLKYDEAVESGNVGNLQIRPECDGDGFYASYKCVPGEICYCQDEYGGRIFGEIPFTPLASKLLHCTCSRHNAKSVRQLGNFGNTWSQMRCLPDGSFDPIQCIDQIDDEGCLCVDKSDGVPTYPDQPLVNITAVHPNLLPCFDNKTHTEFDYYHACEERYNRNYADNQEFTLEGYDVYSEEYANCQMDGNFASIQKNDKEVFCADSNGDKIENYTLSRDDPGVADMNCNCARANLLISGLERPECTANGNYKKLQCRRGECRCVDDNGNQIEKEVSFEIKETLSCYETPEI